jgi:hypothetical protein
MLRSPPVNIERLYYLEGYSEAAATTSLETEINQLTWYPYL